MNSARKFALAAATAATTVLMAGSALAQEAEQGMALPGQQGATAAAGDTDHDMMAGRLAIGYMGRFQIPIGSFNGTPGTLSAPAVGVRYWLDPGMGIDAGLGLVSTSGKTEASGGGQTTTTEDPSFFGLILHAGVPLSLYASKHYSFQIVPELNVGFASATVLQAGNAQADVELSGFHLDIGARAGAEVHFGFIGIPELSLQGSVGLLVTSSSTTVKDTGPGGIETTRSDTIIGTTVGDNPWNIFTSNVAALYYF